MSLESYVLDIIEGKRESKGFVVFLYILSCFYRVGVIIRNWAYDKKILKTTRAPVPVISVGNIVAGGTGKTPLVALLAEELSKVTKVAILSRGYRSKIEAWGSVLPISIGKGPVMPLEECGDEPYWFATQLKDVDVWVGKNRVQAAHFASQQGAKVVILDDGMQYRALGRQFEIVTMDAGDLFGRGYFLPRGLLRDLPQRLACADVIVVSSVRDYAHAVYLQEALTSYSAAKMIGVRMELEVPLAGKRVGVFCGIAKPERFLQTVRKHGAQVVDQFVVEDHRALSMDQLRNFALRAKDLGAECLVCTEKDAVKLPSEHMSCLPILPLKAHLEMVYGEETWKKLIEHIIEQGVIGDERRI